MITRVEHHSTDGLRRAIVTRVHHGRYMIATSQRPAVQPPAAKLPWEHVAVYYAWFTRGLQHANGVARRWCQNGR